MLLPLALVAGGFICGWSRNRTFTNVERRELLGPKSGIVYKAEIFHSIPLLAVQAPDGSTIQFQGTDLVFQAAHGDIEVIKAACADFQGSPLFKGLARTEGI